MLHAPGQRTNAACTMAEGSLMLKWKNLRSKVKFRSDSAATILVDSTAHELSSIQLPLQYYTAATILNSY